MRNDDVERDREQWQFCKEWKSVSKQLSECALENCKVGHETND